MKPVITSIRFSSGPERKKPRAGDRRTTKKHGLQVRIPQNHNGMGVVAHGRPCYEWVSPADVPKRYCHHLTPQEQAQYFPT